MKFLSSLLVLATSAIAAPITTTTKESKHFNLKTSGATNENHNNLYVYAYHTGAGLNDAVLTTDASIASPVYLNGTNAVVDLKSELPWGLIATGNTNYACEYCHIPQKKSVTFQPGLTRYFYPLSLVAYGYQRRQRRQRRVLHRGRQLPVVGTERLRWMAR